MPFSCNFSIFFWLLWSCAEGIFRARCGTGMDRVQILLVGLSPPDKTWKFPVGRLCFPAWRICREEDWAQPHATTAVVVNEVTDVVVLIHISQGYRPSCISNAPCISKYKTIPSVNNVNYKIVMVRKCLSMKWENQVLERWRNTHWIRRKEAHSATCSSVLCFYPDRHLVLGNCRNGSFTIVMHLFCGASEAIITLTCTNASMPHWSTFTFFNTLSRSNTEKNTLAACVYLDV